MPLATSIPELPGEIIPPEADISRHLRNVVARMCGLDPNRFPGSQPISFGARNLDQLEREDFWVAEKSDGLRCLFFVYTDISVNPGVQSVYLIDRHNHYRLVTGFFFPSHENPQLPMKSTLIDGELVVDTDPTTEKSTLRFLAFDCLVAADQNVMARPLDKRYGRLNEWFYRPYATMVNAFPDVRQAHPFDIKVKEINLSYHAEKVFTMDIPALQHGNDGLIYTCVNTPYAAGGTDPNILKWKPPSENSIDFKLVLRFPSSLTNPSVPDFCEKPFFALHTWLGGKGHLAKYELYDELYVTDEEWENMKDSGEQFDDRIIEVHWDGSHWRKMRFRDDKPQGNHRSVVDNIIQSIQEGVEKEELLARSNSIRNAWKTRLAHPGLGPPLGHAGRQSQGGQPPPPQSRQPLVDVRRYGPLASPAWSKVAGPTAIAGMKR